MSYSYLIYNGALTYTTVYRREDFKIHVYR